MSSYREYAKSMKEQGMQPMNERQWKYINSQDSATKANEPQSKRLKKMRRLL